VRPEPWVPANDRWYYIVERVRHIRMSWRRTARDEAQERFDEDACAGTAGRLMAAAEERESPPVCFELPEQAPANDLPPVRPRTEISHRTMTKHDIP